MSNATHMGTEPNKGPASPSVGEVLPLYWRTKFGSIVERQAGPDRDGCMHVRRLTDDAIREWNVGELTPVSTEEVLAMARAEVQS